jgi:hypothetical protein
MSFVFLGRRRSGVTARYAAIGTAFVGDQERLYDAMKMNHWYCFSLLSRSVLVSAH